MAASAPAQVVRRVAMACVLCGLVGAQPAFAHHEGTPSGVSVVAAQSSVTIPGSIKLTVSADRHL